MPRGGRHLAVLLFACAAALAVSGSAQSMAGCAARVVSDWRDGRIDRVYPVHCYREALQALPEDLRIYSSAETDIKRALQNRVQAKSAATAHSSAGGNGSPSPYLVALVSLGLAVGAGSFVALAR